MAKKSKQKFFVGLSIITLLFLGVFLGSKHTTPVSDTRTDNFINKCKTLAEGLQAQCWEDLIEASLNYSNLEKTLNLMERLYQNEPVFAANCHAYTHITGQFAYKKFSANQTLKVTTATSLCSYGFYHGFMEVLVSTGDDIKKAGDFCRDIDKQLSNLDQKAASSCYHGIGHGTATPNDASLRGKAQLIIDPANSLCQQVASTAPQLDDCVFGVYSALGTFYANGDYGLVLDGQNPLALCPTQTEPNKSACYRGMIPALMKLTDNNFLKAAKIIESIPEDLLAQNAIAHLSGPVIFADTKRTDYSQSIADCQSLQLRLRWSCLEGFLRGITEFHGKESGPQQAINFCQSRSLGREERSQCFEYMLANFSRNYSKQEFQKVCELIDESYPPYCQKV